VAQRCGHAESTLLGDGRDFLLGGGGPSVADLYLYVVMSWSPLCGFDLAPYPSLRALLGRVKRLPVVLAAEARMTENPPRV
jgi:glutathione S-transferase